MEQLKEFEDQMFLKYGLIFDQVDQVGEHYNHIVEIMEDFNKNALEYLDIAIETGDTEFQRVIEHDMAQASQMIELLTPKANRLRVRQEDKEKNRGEAPEGESGDLKPLSLSVQSRTSPWLAHP